MIFLVSMTVMIVVSYMTEPPSEASIRGLTFGTESEEDRLLSRSSWNRTDVASSVIVLLLILLAYIYFNG